MCITGYSIQIPVVHSQAKGKVIHFKYYEYLKEVVLAQPFGHIINELVSGRLARESNGPRFKL